MHSCMNRPLTRRDLANERDSDGIDGMWSTFGIQLGTPAQRHRVFFASDENTIWAVHPWACLLTNPEVTNTGACNISRGFVYNSTLSNSSADLGGYSLGYNEAANLSSTAESSEVYKDVATLGWTNPAAPTLQNQIVWAFDANFPWLGILGLNNGTVVLDIGNNDTQTTIWPSVMASLKQQNLMPSYSWAYTAGVCYRSIYGSLTVGGYDASRRGAQEIDVPFNEIMTVTLRDVAINGSGFSSSSQLDTPISMVINTMVSNIWLPTDTCDSIATAFSLTWNETYQVYLIDDSTHSTLSALNPEVVFTVAADTSTGANVTIHIPYMSFNQTLGPPLIPTAMRYFPLHRAQNSSQYVLGRVFMQHAYVVMSYDQNSFSLSQALLPAPGTSTNLLPISSTAVSTTMPTSASTPHNSNAGAIAGGVVGGVVIVGIIALLLLWKHRHDKNKATNKTPEPVPRMPITRENPANRRASHPEFIELPSPRSLQPSELPSPPSEMPSPPHSSWSRSSPGLSANGPFFPGTHELQAGYGLWHYPKVVELPADSPVDSVRK